MLLEWTLWDHNHNLKKAAAPFPKDSPQSSEKLSDRRSRSRPQRPLKEEQSALSVNEDELDSDLDANEISNAPVQPEVCDNETLNRAQHQDRAVKVGEETVDGKLYAIWKLPYTRPAPTTGYDQ